MKKKLIVNPIGLKGQEINERVKELMGITPIDKNFNTMAIELTKLGPDGNAYAVIRENREWYIKKANKNKNLVLEDFKYIGGLQNKKQEAYPSYAKAIKHLNLKFKSLAEAYNFDGYINVFENDNLLSENVLGFGEMKGNGFTGEGNLEENNPIWEGNSKNNPWAICTSKVGREDKEKYEACVKDIKKQNGIDESITENEFCGSVEEDIEMSEAEKAVDAMLHTEVRGPWSYSSNNYTDDVENNKEEEELEEGKLSIEEAITRMDSFIDQLTKGLKKKVK